jgi:hypothetical protein
MDTLSVQLAQGHLTFASAAILLALAFVFSVTGGALAGIALAGKDLGNPLAALMGAMFGPTAALPAAATGLFVLVWL